MKSISTNIMADSLTGALFALDGINHSTIILNGPTGCKFYHSSISDGQLPRTLAFDPLNYPEEFYFGQPRIPCTYLDGYDYVYGSSLKLEKILDLVKDNDYDLVAIVNSPGAALIGDDLNHFFHSQNRDTVCLSLESTGFSGNYSDGFQNAVISLMKKIATKQERTQNITVNLVGISLYNKHYEGNILELKRLLKLCGIEVLSTLCVDEDINTLRSASKAHANIIVYPEYGSEIAKWMDESLDVPWIKTAIGPPIGFDSTEKFIKNICEHLNINPQKALDDLSQSRARAYLYLSRFNSLLGLPTGATFSIKAEASMALALTKDLMDYYGMLPVALECNEDSDQDTLIQLKDYLMVKGFQKPLTNLISENDADIVFADGNTISQLHLKRKQFTGIEIALPSLGYIDVMAKCNMGTRGALFLIEQIINGLNYDT